MVQMVAKVLQKLYILIIIGSFRILSFIGIILYVFCSYSQVNIDQYWSLASFVAALKPDMLTSFVNGHIHGNVATSIVVLNASIIVSDASVIISNASIVIVSNAFVILTGLAPLTALTSRAQSGIPSPCWKRHNVFRTTFSYNFLFLSALVMLFSLSDLIL